MTVRSEDFAFRTPQELIGYTEIHQKTPRALMRMDQIAVLGLLAGIEGSEEALGSKEFLSLHLFDTHKLIESAKQRLSDNDVYQSQYENILRRWAYAQGEENTQKPSRS